MKVYVASPFFRWHRAKRLRGLLRALGTECVCQWIDDAEACGGRETTDDAVMQAALARNYADLLACDAVIALTYLGEGGEMFAECGVALHVGKPVLWVGDRAIASTWHRLSVRFDETQQALQWLNLRALEVQP